MIKKITSSGVISIFAGSGSEGRVDGVGTNATFNHPWGITVDQHTGNIFVTDYGNHSIRKITPQGEVFTLAGSGGCGFSDGIEKSALFNKPRGICFGDHDNALFICDTKNHKIRKLFLGSGEVTTICEIRFPTGISITPNGSLLVTSRDAHQVVFVSRKEGKYVTKILAGSGHKGSEDGPALKCSFNKPYGIDFDPKTNTCFVADFHNSKIRKFTLM